MHSLRQKTQCTRAVVRPRQTEAEILPLRKGDADMKALLFFLAVPLLAEPVTCSLAVVNWLDATLHTSRGEAIDLSDTKLLLTKQVSFGCTMEKEGVVIVIHNFVGDTKPTEYTAIPKGWVTDVTYLTKEVTDDRPKAAGDVASLPRLHRFLHLLGH